MSRPRPTTGEALRIAEALLFAAREPLAAQELAGRLPEGSDVAAVLADLAEHYADRGVNLVQVAGKWAFRTAGDLSFLLARDVVEPRKLSRAAMETLAIVAYHQPVTRAEIEEIRGVVTSKGTLDTLLETGWIRLRGRRKAPGRPVTYGTTPRFLEHFGLDAVDDLPGLEELKGRRHARRPHPARPVGAGPLRRHDAARRRGPARGRPVPAASARARGRACGSRAG